MEKGNGLVEIGMAKEKRSIATAMLCEEGTAMKRHRIVR